jgi:hypothetical protein
MKERVVLGDYYAISDGTLQPWVLLYHSLVRHPVQPLGEAYYLAVL